MCVCVCVCVKERTEKARERKSVLHERASEYLCLREGRERERAARVVCVRARACMSLLCVCLCVRECVCMCMCISMFVFHTMHNTRRKLIQRQMPSHISEYIHTHTCMQSPSHMSDCIRTYMRVLAIMIQTALEIYFASVHIQNHCRDNATYC